MTTEGGYRQILLLTDSTEAGGRAAERAIALAQESGAQLTAVAVLDTETLKQLLTSRVLVADEMADYEAELEATGEKQVKYVQALADEAGQEIETALLRGSCHSCVLQKCRTRQIDLIVLGGFKSAALKTDLLAREKQYIIDEAPAAVLMVK